MALYLGNDKVKVNLNGSKFKLDLCPSKVITNLLSLKEADGLVLKDANGLYLIVREDK